MSKNDVTGDSLTTKASTDKYREGWDRIFGKKEATEVMTEARCTAVRCTCKPSQMLTCERMIDSVVTTKKLPRHKFWGAGEPDCPEELKAPNGELHTTLCKVCGDGWHESSDVCLVALCNTRERTCEHGFIGPCSYCTPFYVKE
jgi:hypothetical protein